MTPHAKLALICLAGAGAWIAVVALLWWAAS